MDTPLEASRLATDIIDGQDLLLHFLEPLHQPGKPLQRHAPVRIGRYRSSVEFLQIHQHPRPAALLPGNPGNRRVVRDAIHPGAERTLCVESFKASP